MGEWITGVDRSILLWVHAHHHPALTPLMMAVSYAGEAAACWWTLGILLLVRKHPLAKQMLLSFVLSLVIGVAFTNLPQVIWFRPRPYRYIEGIHQLGVKWETSAFPSGHTVTSFGGAVVFGFSGWRIRPALLAFAALMGFSRIYAGMHHPSDVLFAAAAGTACGIISWRLAGRILTRRPTKDDAGQGQSAGDGQRSTG